MDEEGENGSSNSRICGLQYATELGFTHAQYEEAIKRIKSPDIADANQLLVALMDVENASPPTPVSTISDNIVNSANATASPVTCCTNQTTSISSSSSGSSDGNHGTMLTGDVVKTGFAPSAPSATTSATTTITNTMVTLSAAFPQDPRDLLMSTTITPMTTPATTSSSSLSSCYSSITSFSSSCSANQSLESLQQQPQVLLKKIYIDGANVALTHGRNLTFSWLGIKLCVDWFQVRHHRVKVFVPCDRCFQVAAQDELILNYLNSLDALIQTPSGCSDDLFIIEAARLNKGVIVSNDLYRDEKRHNAEVKNFIHLHRLPYIFDDNVFIPASDPKGRTGPTLEEFLKEIPEQQQQQQQHHHQNKQTPRYQRNAHSVKHRSYTEYHRSLQSTLSLPILEQTRSLTLVGNNLSNQPLASEQVQQQHQQQQQLLRGGDQDRHHHHHHHHHQTNWNNNNNSGAAGSSYQRRHQQVTKTMSVVYPRSGVREDSVQLAPLGGRLALGRTKSQNI